MMMNISEFVMTLIITVIFTIVFTLIIVFHNERERFDGVGIERIDEYTYSFPGGSSNRFEIIWKDGVKK